MSDVFKSRIVAIPLAIMLIVIVIAVFDKFIYVCSFSADKSLELSGPACLEAWTNRYQTLLSGLLALGGALATVFYLSKQIAQTEKMRENDLERERVAARALLPLVLSIICEYCEECARKLDSIKFHSEIFNNDGETSAPGNFTMPDIPSGVLEPLQQNIRFGEKFAVESIRDMLSTLQIQSARLRTPSSHHTEIKLARDDRLFDVVELHAKILNLFPYARSGKELRSAHQEDYRKSAMLLHLSEIGHRRVFDRINIGF